MLATSEPGGDQILAPPSDESMKGDHAPLVLVAGAQHNQPPGETPLLWMNFNS
jgi:hypothetical protein